MDRYSTWLTVAILLTGILLRVAWVEADPDYYNWFGFYIDEWRWTEVARTFFHTGGISFSPRNYNTILAPGFEAATLLSYQILGASLFSVRVFPIMCGVGLIVALYLHLRRRASPVGILCAVSLLAIQADLVNLSRVAIPDIASMAGGLLTWIAVDAARGRRLALAGAGLVLAVALSFKLTSYYLIPAFVLVVFWQRKGDGLKVRLADAGSLISGLAAPGIVALIVLANRLPLIEVLVRRLDVPLNFLEPSTIFTIVSRPFVARGAPFLNTGMLALWFGLVALMVVWSNPVSAEPRGTQRRLEGSLIWVATLSFVMEIQAYFPERYMAHILIPLALVAAFAMTRLEAVGLAGLTTALSSLRGHRKFLAVSTMSLPTIVLAAPVFAGILTVLGAAPDRLSPKLLAIGLASPFVVAVAATSESYQRALRVALAIWRKADLGWLIAWGWSENGLSFWPADAIFQHGLIWLIVLGVIFAGVYTAVGLTVRRAWNPFRVGGIAASVMWAFAWLGLLLPGITNPQFTLREASNDLPGRLSSEPEIHQFVAGGLFLDNSLDFSRISYATVSTDLPQYVVVRIPYHSHLRVLGERYDLIKSYNLHVSSRYLWAGKNDAEDVCGPVRGFCVGVYERR